MPVGSTAHGRRVVDGQAEDQLPRALLSCGALFYTTWADLGLDAQAGERVRAGWSLGCIVGKPLAGSY